MEISETSREIQRLEDRYYELNRDLRAVRLQIGIDDPIAGSREQLAARVEKNMEEMHAILREITGLEDSLLD